jgi:Kef-type K+ transport system membrane component KefB
MASRSRDYRRVLILAAACVSPLLAAGSASAHTDRFVSFLFSFAVALLAAKLGGELAERAGQPSVLGELLAGMILGNATLAGLTWFEVLKADELLGAMAEMGVILLLFEVGYESHIGELVAVGRSAFLVANIGIIVPMGLGYAVSSLLLPGEAWYVHLFSGATLSATSVGITARVLQDLRRTESREAKIVLGAAVIDDVLGLIVLAVVSGMVSSVARTGSAAFEWGPVAIIVLKAVAFVAGAIWIGRYVHLRAVKIGSRFRTAGIPLTLAVTYCFILAALAGKIGLAPIVGAFAAGLVLEEGDYEHYQHHSATPLDRLIRPMTMVFVPIFFVVMGLMIDLRTFASPRVLLFAALLTLVAIAGKIVAALGVIERGVNRLAVGAGMIPRGEVGLIFVGIGATLEVAGKPVFPPELVSAMVVMVMVTTLMTPPLIKSAFVRSRPPD